MAPKSFLISDGAVVTPAGVIDPGVLHVQGGTIAGIWPKESAPQQLIKRTPSIDGRGLYVMAGFIDQHIHGAMGFDVMDDNDSALDAIATVAPSFGVTSICPATMAAPVPKLVSILGRIANAAERDVPLGARILGANLEGPFLSPQACGAHERTHIFPPTLNIFRKLQDAARGHLMLMTVAPEVEGALQLIEYASRRDVVVSIGHTHATFEQTCDGIIRGARCATHMFNAMLPIDRRQPGPSAALLLASHVALEVIADGHLLQPGIVQIICTVAGPGRVILISDSLRPVGLAAREPFTLGRRRVYVRDGVCVLSSGRIWGSLLTLNRAVANVADICNYDPVSLSIMASQNAAKLLGWWSTKGSLEVGKDADILLCDRNYRLVQTFTEGNCTYQEVL